MIDFRINDPSIESQWRAIILFGRNSATYKFAFAKSLLELASNETTRITLKDLAIPFSREIINHLKQNDKQGSSSSSTFLNHCRSYLNGNITENDMISHTEKLGFVNVIDAFQNVNGDIIPNPFYKKNFKGGNKEIVITDDLLRLKENFQFQNFNQEVEARWNLVETAWNMKLNPKLLEVKYDESNSMFFLESNQMRRTDITSVRDALNGYQKGKCFFSFQDISINSTNNNLCEVDHFFPHMNKLAHAEVGANINGVWNLVLANGNINNEKRAKIPEKRFLQRLHNRNEFYINSKHPLSETIQNQTGSTPEKRIKFLEQQYSIALNNSIHKWKPSIELIGSF
ncbi:HNH endonuclease [Vicingaceae bacterium]|nr:HNH endonuclease [Vicingaceae bacterium]